MLADSFAYIVHLLDLATRQSCRKFQQNKKAKK
jgi:hypothetical protein